MSKRLTFEDLSDEILMEIFDSFSLPIEIYSSFFNLNQRLNKIVRDSRLLMSVDLTSRKNPFEFVYHCQVMFPQMKSQLISLRLANEKTLFSPMEFFLRFQRFNSFENLRQLSLIKIDFDQLRRTFVEIISLNKLKRLDIEMFDSSGVTPTELDVIANLFFSKSKSIRTLNLRFNRECRINDLPSKSLKEFSLDCCFTDDVYRLLQNSIDFQRLKLKVENSTRRSTFFRPNFSSFLTEFHLEITDLTFDDIRSFVLFLPHLNIFSLEGLSYDLKLTQGELWRNLIEKNLKFLKKFLLNSLRIWLGNNADDIQNESHANLVQDIYRTFSTCFPSIFQHHKLRPNHLSLTLRVDFCL